MAPPLSHADDFASRSQNDRTWGRRSRSGSRTKYIGVGVAASLAALLEACAVVSEPTAMAKPVTMSEPAFASTSMPTNEAQTQDTATQDTATQDNGAQKPPAQTPPVKESGIQAMDPFAARPLVPGLDTTTPAHNGGEKAPPPDAFPIHGSLSSIYRGRFSDGDHDHDLTEILSMDFGDPLRNAWTGHLMTRVNVDLDGHSSGPSPFNGLDDTYGTFLVPHVYDAWAQKSDVGALDYVRIGRQTLWDTPVFAWFDGIGTQTKPTSTHNWLFGAYGGIPTHLYESAHSGDLMAGGYAQGEPWKDGRVRLDYMHIADEGALGSHSNGLWRASGWQSFGKNLRVDGWYSLLDGEGRDVMARATWNEVESDFSLTASWFRLLTAQRDQSLELDPYFSTLGELFPYHQGRLLASKGFGEHVNVETGLDVRKVSDDDDQGQFNRDSNRLFATVTLSRLLPAELDLALTGERWNGDGSDVDTWGFDLSRRFSDAVSASLGSYFALYKVDSFGDVSEERDNVRTLYLRLRWRRTENTTWDARYDIEDAADTTYQTVRLGLTWAF